MRENVFVRYFRFTLPSFCASRLVEVVTEAFLSVFFNFAIVKTKIFIYTRTGTKFDTCQIVLIVPVLEYLIRHYYAPNP